MKQLSDDELVEGYRASQRHEFLSEIFLRYSDIAFRTAFQFSKNNSDAEDAAQNAFIKCMHDLGQYQLGTNFKAWLMRIVVNTCKNKKIEEQRRFNRHEKYAEQKENYIISEDMAEKEELQTMVKNSVEMLPEKYKVPIWMVMYEGFTYPEVASVLSLPEKTIRTQVVRGMSKLRETLGSLGHILSLDMIAMTMKQTTQEVAPATLKSLISAPELYQIPVKNVMGESRKILLATKSKSTFSMVKLFLFVLIGGFVVIGGYFILKPVKPVILLPDTMMPVPVMQAKETNRTWDFNNEKDRDLKLFFGEWEWSEQLKAMTPPINKTIMISLPINYQEKPFVIEALIKLASTLERPDLKLLFTGYWGKNGKLISHDTYIMKTKYKFPVIAHTQKIYFYKNYICIFIQNECVQINKLNADLVSASPALTAINIYFQKITSRTLQEVPEEVLGAIQKIANEKPDLQGDWEFDEKGNVLEPQ